MSDRHHPVGHWRGAREHTVSTDGIRPRAYRAFLGARWLLTLICGLLLASSARAAQITPGSDLCAAINALQPGEELALAHPVISREFGIAHMETHIGLARSEALKNMGVRTGNPAIQQLVAMVVQAERFGTSIAGALRIQSETLRVKRQHVAEEMAAKASVKMSFPLVLFIFPATFIVLAGPTVLGLFKSDLFK